MTTLKKIEKQKNDKKRRERRRDLEDGGSGGDERERGLDTAGGVGGESGLNELSLEVEGGSGGSLQISR